MTIKASGRISFDDVTYELGYANGSIGITLNDSIVREIANSNFATLESSISFNNLYNKYTPFVLFAGGYTTSITGTSEEFKIISEVRTSSTSISARTGLFGASGSSKGVFMGGETSSGITNITQAYEYASKSVSSYSNAGVQRYVGCSASAYDFGFFIAGADYLGAQTNIVEQLYIPSDFYVSLTSLSVSLVQSAATFYPSGNYILVVAGAGSLGGTAINLTKKYSLDSYLTSSGTNLTAARKSLSGAGVNSYGIFAGGISDSGVAMSTSEQYTYSSSSVSARGALDFAKYGSSAAGNSERLFFAGGVVSGSASSSSEYYRISGGTWITSTSLGTAKYGHAGVCTHTVGVS